MSQTLDQPVRFRVKSHDGKVTEMIGCIKAVLPTKFVVETAYHTVFYVAAKDIVEFIR